MSPLLAYLQPADSQRSHPDLWENKKQTKTSPSERRYGTNSEISPSKVSKSIFSDQKYGKFGSIREERESGKQNDVVKQQLVESLFHLNEDEIKNVKMAKVTSESKVFEKVSDADLQNYSKNVSKFTNE